MHKLKVLARFARPRINDRAYRFLHKGHGPVHCLYFAIAASEGHWYGIAAGLMLFFTVCDLIHGTEVA